jgi:LysR family transcriptional regulator, low CO2-responsive transcriptional regulator
MKTLTFRQLRVFQEVARSLSFARAAENLHLSAPAVTMQIKEVEAKVGLPLFDRQARQVSLTIVGEYFLVYVKRILATAREAENVMARFKRLEAGLLTIGIVSTAQYFVPGMLARFRAEHGGVDVKLQVMPNRERLVALLQTGEIDLAIMGRAPRELDTRAEGFAAHPLVFVGPPDHPLLSIGHPPLKALLGFPLIVREQGSGTRTVTQQLFAEQRLEPRIGMEVSNNEAIKQAVMAGLGISLLSLHTLSLEIQAGLLKIIAVEGTPVMRAWNIVHLLSKTLSPAAEAFRYFLIEHAEAFLSERDASLLDH